MRGRARGPSASRVTTSGPRWRGRGAASPERSWAAARPARRRAGARGRTKRPTVPLPRCWRCRGGTRTSRSTPAPGFARRNGSEPDAACTACCGQRRFAPTAGVPTPTSRGARRIPARGTTARQSRGNGERLASRRRTATRRTTEVSATQDSAGRAKLCCTLPQTRHDAPTVLIARVAHDHRHCRHREHEPWSSNVSPTRSRVLNERVA